jgi:hypothetical protein
MQMHNPKTMLTIDPLDRYEKSSLVFDDRQ